MSRTDPVWRLALEVWRWEFKTNVKRRTLSSKHETTTDGPRCHLPGRARRTPSIRHEGNPVALGLALATMLASAALGQSDPPTPKPVPRMQAIPLPNAEISFQRDGVELTRYHFATNQNRPFLFPILGPSGRSLTRLGHPHDPMTHSHHNSVWISHNDIDGQSAWDDRGTVRIVHQQVEQFTDGDLEASVLVLNHWVDDADNVLLTERRRLSVQPLPKDEWMLLIDLLCEAGEDNVTLGKTPFGLLGVRMAKTIGVNDGGGTIRNSLGGVNEKEVLWKAALWVDYSGPITPRAIEGITLLDHPSNPNHPTVFHVRNDGWMGAALTFDAPRTIAPGQPLRVRYGLYVHAGQPSTNQIQRRWQEFAHEPIAAFPAKKK